MGLLCTFDLLFNIAKGEFKFKSKFKPIGTNEMCCLLSKCSSCRIEKGVINCKFKHLKTNHRQLWGRWSEQEKDGPKAKRHLTKKGLVQPLMTVPISLVLLFNIPKMIPIKNILKRTLCC